MLLLQIILSIIYIISIILLLDLFYAEKKIEYFKWKKKNLEKMMDGRDKEWASKSKFWEEEKNSEISIWSIALIPLINIFYYAYALWYLNNSVYEDNVYRSKWDVVYTNGYSLNSYIWSYLKKVFK